MKLTSQEATELVKLAKWFNVEPEKLIHKILQDQIVYLRKVQYECSKKECPSGKYAIAQRLKLLD